MPTRDARPAADLPPAAAPASASPIRCPLRFEGRDRRPPGSGRRHRRPSPPSLFGNAAPRSSHSPRRAPHRPAVRGGPLAARRALPCRPRAVAGFGLATARSCPGGPPGSRGRIRRPTRPGRAAPSPVRPGEGRPAPDWQPRRARRGTPALRLAANRVPRAEARGSPSRDRVPRRVGGPSPDRNPVPPLRATVSLAFDEPLPAGDRPRTRPHRDASPRPAPDGRPRCAPDPRPPCRRGRVAPDATPAGRPSCLRWTAPVPRRMIAPRGGFQPPPRLVLAGPRSGFQPPTRPRRRPGFASALPSAPVSSTQPPCARTPVQPARPGPAASAVLHTRPWPRHIVG